MRRWLTAAVMLALILGAVPRQVGAAESPLFAPFSELGLTEFDVGRIDQVSHEVEGNTTFFRHASDVELQPTLSPDANPDVVPLRVGSAQLNWSTHSLPALPEGTFWVDAGDGLQLDRDYVVFWAQMAGPLDVAEDGGDVGAQQMMYQQISFVLEFPDMEGWQPHADFPFDTWRNGAVNVSLDYGPDPWSLNLFEVNDNGDLEPMLFNGFAAGIDNTWIVAIEAAPVLAEGAYPRDVGFRFANRKHDGSFGFCNDCLAIHGATPGGHDETGFTDWYSIIDIGIIEVGTTPPPTTTTTTTTVVAAPTTTTTKAPPETTTTAVVATTTTATSTTGGGGEFPWGWFLGTGGLLAGLGWLIYQLSAKRNCLPLLKDWQTKQKRCDTSLEELNKARQWLREKRNRLGELQEELSSLERARRSSIEMRDVEYHRIPEGLVTTEGLESIVSAKQDQIAGAGNAVATGEEMVERWEEMVEQHCGAAAAAKRLYGDCIGAEPPPLESEGGGDGGHDQTQPGGKGPGVDSGGDSPTVGRGRDTEPPGRCSDPEGGEGATRRQPDGDPR